MLLKVNALWDTLCKKEIQQKQQQQKKNSFRDAQITTNYVPDLA